MGGDFNCALTQSDSTGWRTFSCSLSTLVEGYALTDTWQENSPRKIYTHFIANGAGRFDCIYLSRDLMARKLGIQTVAATIMDHTSIVLLLTLNAPILRQAVAHGNLNAPYSPRITLWNIYGKIDTM